MKIFLNKFYYLFIFLFGIMDLIAGNGSSSGPPEPTGRTTQTAGGPVVPPGLPIDDNIVFLFIVALLLAFYIIYTNSAKSKDSI